MMKKLRIMMVAPTPFPGNRGTPSRILDMSLALKGLGHEIHVVTYHLRTETPTDGLYVHRIPNIPTYRKMGPGPSLQKLAILDPLLMLKVWQVANRIDFDILHGHSYEGFLASLPTARIKGKRLVYDAHSTLIGEMPSYEFLDIKVVMRFLDRKVPKWADHIIAVSKTLKDFILEKGQVEDRVSVVPTGVNVSQFEGHNPDVIRRKLGISNEMKIVAYTGSMANFQGVDYLIEAMKEVLVKCQNVVLLLIGNSNERKYRAMCVEKGMENDVIITGERPFDEIPLFLACADVAVIPRTECPGIPQKLTNYMAAGKAIVSFEGSAKLLSNGFNGIVVKDFDIKGMANAIIKVLKDPRLRRDLGSEAKRTILEKYEWKILSRKVERVYMSLLDSN
jgi:1,2-diacylglycerol 3-alpha-glucosyltransferase